MHKDLDWEMVRDDATKHPKALVLVRADEQPSVCQIPVSAFFGVITNVNNVADVVGVQHRQEDEDDDKESEGEGSAAKKSKKSIYKAVVSLRERP